MNLFIAASRFSQNSLFNVSIIPPVFLILCKYKGFLRKSQRIISFFSKTYQSSLTLKGGSTAFPKPLFLMEKVGCTRQFESELSLRSFAQPFPSGDKGCANRPTRCYFFRKPTSPPLTLREGPPLISVFSPQGRRGNRPTRCSNRYAIRLADHQRSTPAAELRFFVRG